MVKFTPLLLLVLLSSCFLLRDLKRERFTYNANGQARTLVVQVPRGFDREKLEVDSAGNTTKFYNYSNGTVYYVAHLVDTARQLQFINYGINMPLEHINGGWIYKGQDSTGRYWREIRVGPYKYGYRAVPRLQEGDFDEALNWSSLQQAK